MKTWRKDQAVNLETFFLTSQAVARHMLENKGGAIVGTVSITGTTSGVRHAAYGAAKAGLVNLVRAMACEWAPAIRVNAVSPGAVETLRQLELRAKMSEEVIKASLKPIPMKRMGSPDEMAKAGLFLLSDLASYVSGATLPVDGGWSANYPLDLSMMG